MNTPVRPARKARLSVDEGLIRRDRIFARRLDGQSHAAIAAAEAITPRRLRRIAQEGLSPAGAFRASGARATPLDKIEFVQWIVERAGLAGTLVE
jgi:hypothetical protein